MKRKNMYIPPPEEKSTGKIRCREEDDLPLHLRVEDFDREHLALESFEERGECQEIEVYMSNHDNRYLPPRPLKNEEPLDVDRDIDPIDPRLPGRVNAKIIQDAFGELDQLSAKNALKHGLQLLTNPTGEQKKAMMRSNEEKAAYYRKKGIGPEPKRPITSLVSRALRRLAEKSNLYYLTQRRDEIQVANGAFFVEKSNKKLRVIFDGRYANAHFKPSHAKFKFFQFEVLRHVIGNLSTNDKWYAVNVDLRHWFHQIAIPGFFQPYLAMSLTDQGNKPGSFWARARTLPMGWIFAPYLAQCCTWGLLLSCPERRAVPREADVDLKFMQAQRKRNTPYTWIPLVNGGGIFVFLDNVLVVTPRQATADFWFNKIVDDCKFYRAALKGPTDDFDFEAPAEEQKDILRPPSFFVLDKNDPDDKTGFDFLGVNWNHSYRRVKVDKDEIQKLPLSWSGTRRQMAGILGKIMWYRRVHGISYFDQATSSETDSILKVYSILTPEENNKFGWDTSLSVPPNIMSGICAAWTRRTNCTGVKAETFKVRIDPKKIGFAITDAATLQSGKGGISAMWYSPFTPASSEMKRVLTSEDFNVAVGEFDSSLEKIAHGELRAIILAVENLVKEGKELIILATDNTSCKYWIEKGHAHDERIRALLAHLDSTLKSNNTRLFVTYVPTDDNIADEPSRLKPVDWTKIGVCHQLLTEAYYDSISSLWQISGGQTGGDEMKLKTV